MGVELWEQTTWDKTQVLLGTYWEHGNKMRTHWEQWKNKKSIAPCPLKKKKNLDHS
jgi:hypothetical protein